VLERLVERSDSLPAESTLVSTTLQALGGATVLWKRLFAVPLSIHTEALTLAQPHSSMDNLKLVEKSTLLLLLHELTKTPAVKASRTGATPLLTNGSWHSDIFAHGFSSSSSGSNSARAGAGAASGAALVASIPTTKLVFDLLTWCCANAGSAAQFNSFIDDSGLDLVKVDPTVLLKFIEPMAALSPARLLDVYRAQSIKWYPSGAAAATM
jgi:hypothetical protein